jgi:hypothetical protein
MTGIAFCREPLPALARSKLMSWALRGSDRGGQDKSRKVRAVGSLRNSLKFGLFANLANVSPNLRFSAMHYRPSKFYTPRSDR